MRDQEWDCTTAKLDALDLAELVLGLLGLDTVDGETALGVVDETEVLAGLLDGDDVHEPSGVGHVGADLGVDLDEALHQDGPGLAEVERILEAVADEDDQGKTVAELVRTGRGLGSVGTGQFVKQPVRGGAKALLMLLAMKKVSIFMFFHVDVSVQRVSVAHECSSITRHSQSIALITYIPRAILTTVC